MKCQCSWLSMFVILPAPESVQEKVLSQGVLDILDAYLKNHSQDVGVVQMALLAVGSLSDTGMIVTWCCVFLK